MSNTFKHLITGLLCIPVLVSCDTLEPFFETLFEPSEPSVLKIDGRTLSDAFDTALTFDISCDISFTAELEGGEWATITSTERNKDKTGGSVAIRFDYNTSEDPRTCTLVVKAGSEVTKKEFKQFGISNFFSPRSINLYGTDMAILEFNTPKSWTAKIVKGQDWFNINDSSGQTGKAFIHFIAKDANENVGPRDGLIVVTIDGKDLEVPVTQVQKDVIYAGDAPEYTLDWHGGELQILARFNVDYNVSVAADWIHHISTKALNEDVELFTIDEHPGEETRSVSIFFTGKDNHNVSASVSITQTGLDNVLRHSTPGLYGIEGGTFLLGSGGWNHSSRVSRSDGTIDYRLMNPSSLSVLTVSDIKTSAEVGDECYIHIVRKDKTDITAVVEYPAVLIGSSEELLWFKNSKDTYFIIQK